MGSLLARDIGKLMYMYVALSVRFRIYLLSTEYCEIKIILCISLVLFKRRPSVVGLKAWIVICIITVGKLEQNILMLLRILSSKLSQSHWKYSSSKIKLYDAHFIRLEIQFEIIGSDHHISIQVSLLSMSIISHVRTFIIV